LPWWVLLLPALLLSSPLLLLSALLALAATPPLAFLWLPADVPVEGASLDGGVDVAVDSVDGLPQSLWAAAETACPWSGPGGVS
jgi:hypothetical protein